MRYSFLPSARREIAEVAQWYEDRRDGLGDEFLEEFELCIAQILRRPTSFAVEEHAPSGSELRQFAFRRFPYRVIYRVGEQQVIVIAVAHASRRPDDWLDRLDEE